MSHIGDSRNPGPGMGLLPLQAWEKVDDDDQTVVVGVRVLDRMRGGGEYGHRKLQADTLGIVRGAFFWGRGETAGPQTAPADAQSPGGIARWSWCWPTRILGRSTVSQTAGASALEPGLVLPLLRDWNPDGTYTTLGTVEPTQWPDLLGGTFGITVQSSEDDSQTELFMPTDPRIIAAHLGAASGGTPVCDVSKVGGQFHISQNRAAPLQSMLRVIPATKSNALAWNVTTSGQGDTAGGYVYDNAAGGKGGGVPGRGPTSGGGLRSLGTAPAVRVDDGGFGGPGNDPNRPYGGPRADESAAAYLKRKNALDKLRREGKGVGKNGSGSGNGVNPGNPGASNTTPNFIRGAAPWQQFGIRDRGVISGSDVSVVGGFGVRGGRILTGGDVISRDGRRDGQVGAWFANGQRRARSSRGGPVIGKVSVHDGGPFDCGDKSDKHQLGNDGDGVAINPVHISTDALYRNQFNAFEDGPMNLQSEWQDGQDMEVPTRVIYAYNPTSGKFDWWTTSPFMDSDPPGIPTPPRDPPRTPGDDPNPPGDPDDPDDPPGGPGGPTTPGGDPRGGTPLPGGPGGRPLSPPSGGGSRRRRRRRPDRDKPRPGVIGSGDRFQYFKSTFRPIGMEALLARPQDQRLGVLDLRSRVVWPQEVLDDWNDTTPLTGRLEAFGAQDGDGWIYTQRPAQSSARGGTAPGGWLMLPPELQLDGRDPATLESESVEALGDLLSLTSLIAGPGTVFAAGGFNPLTGTPANGWMWGVEFNADEAGADDLQFVQVDALGAATVQRTFKDAFERVRVQALAATTSGVQGDSPITAPLVVITAATNPSPAITLPAISGTSGVLGITVKVNHDVGAGGQISVFPASGDSIDGGAADAPITMNPNQIVSFVGYETDRWVSET